MTKFPLGAKVFKYILIENYLPVYMKEFSYNINAKMYT